MKLFEKYKEETGQDFHTQGYDSDVGSNIPW